MKALILVPENRPGLQPLAVLSAQMLPVMNKPLLLRTIDHLKKNGITEIVLCTSGQEEYIKNYFGDGAQFGLSLAYVDCASGPFEQGMQVFRETFIVLEPDVFCNIDLQKMIRFHKNRCGQATLAVGKSMHATSQMNGGLLSSKYNFTGIYVVEPKIFTALDNMIWADKETLRKLLVKTEGTLFYKSHDYWMDIGTVEKYKQVHLDILSGKCRIDDSGEGKGKITLGKNVRIHPTARLLGSVYIGNHVEIGAMARIKDSVIGSDSNIGCESNIMESILWNRVNIRSNVRLTKTVVLTDVTIPVNLHYLGSVVTADEQKPFVQAELL